jgi:hypothetical protein
MPGLRFEPKIPVFERAKTVHALEYAAIVMVEAISLLSQKCFLQTLAAVLYIIPTFYMSPFRLHLIWPSH